MGRYANLGYEKIYDDEGNVKGINFGYSDVLEHSKGYFGDELCDTKFNRIYHKLSKGLVVDKIFYDEKVKNSNDIRLFEGSDGRVLLTNELSANEVMQLLESGYVHSYDEFSIEKIDEMIEKVSNHPDKNGDHFYDVSWNMYTFNIVSTNEEGRESLINLFNNIKNGDVAISSNFPTLFKSRGLSFANLYLLNKEDIEAKYYSSKSKCRRR